MTEFSMYPKLRLSLAMGAAVFAAVGCASSSSTGDGNGNVTGALMPASHAVLSAGSAREAASAGIPDYIFLNHEKILGAGGTLSFPNQPGCQITVDMPYAPSSLGKKHDVVSLQAYPKHSPPTPSGVNFGWSGVMKGPTSNKPATFDNASLSTVFNFNGHLFCQNNSTFYLYAFTSQDEATWTLVSTESLGLIQNGMLTGPTLFENGFTFNTRYLGFVLGYN